MEEYKTHKNKYMTITAWFYTFEPVRNDINIDTQAPYNDIYVYMLLPLNQTYSSSPLISIHEGSCENKSVGGLSIGGEAIEWEDRREREKAAWTNL